MLASVRQMATDNGVPPADSHTRGKVRGRAGGGGLRARRGWRGTGVAEGNDPVPFGDVTIMRKATSKSGAVFGMVALVAAAGLASQATASAETDGHQVRYTLTSTGAADFDLYYLTAQPPSKDAYNADAYSFVKTEKVNLAPGVPWVFETTLADPQWAILTVSSTTHGGQAAPNPHCDIAIDGAVVAQQDAPYSVRCQLGQW